MKLSILSLLLFLSVACQERSHLVKKNYSSEMKTGVYIDDDKIELLEAFDSANSIGCELDMRSGDIYDYKVEEDTLTLSKNDEILVLNRVEGEKNSLLGHWQLDVDKPKYKSHIEIMIPNHYDIMVVEKCRTK